MRKKLKIGNHLTIKNMAGTFILLSYTNNGHDIEAVLEHIDENFRICLKRPLPSFNLILE